MYINIDTILKEKNKTRYWLAKTTKFSYPTIKHICDNKTTAISFEVIEKICKTLDCTPNDIFKF